MMRVDDNIHSLIQRPAGNLLHPVHPVLVNDVVFIHVVMPADRHPDGIETCFLDGGN